MDSLHSTNRSEGEVTEGEEEGVRRSPAAAAALDHNPLLPPRPPVPPPAAIELLSFPEPDAATTNKQQKVAVGAPASESLSESDPTTSNDTEKPMVMDEEEEAEEEDRPSKKHKQEVKVKGKEEEEAEEEEQQQQPEAMTPVEEISNGDEAVNGENGSVEEEAKAPPSAAAAAAAAATTQSAAKKKSKKKSNNNVWSTRSTRKGKKKAKPNPQSTPTEDTVSITPVPRFPDKNDDSPEMAICLSKAYKAEKVELSEDRLSAGSSKGYRMARATRGVCEGAWYFETKVESLGETGHTRLGWSTEKGDLQAPVGYDGNSFGYRDIDGSKIHKALREKYGEEGYKEGDVIGFYINLPDGGSYAPKPPRLVWYKGQRYLCAPDAKEDPPKIVPGSEISFFKNGICQGVAFKDLYGGRYYPAASMYTLPNQPNCVVRFNFGPDFNFFPEDFGGRPMPRPMIEVPYHGFDARVDSGTPNEEKQ
ncbi:unnamed protein product [Linum tenue]|uniref:B30.2/SPRY domain-containing protein n=1 Tax=Linum tenue TaxID=586396 RepID=A0AAV0JTE5_9ROSI|nr:unnamed protein product [Linum tenue]